MAEERKPEASEETTKRIIPTAELEKMAVDFANAERAKIFGLRNISGRLDYSIIADVLLTENLKSDEDLRILKGLYNTFLNKVEVHLMKRYEGEPYIMRPEEHECMDYSNTIRDMVEYAGNETDDWVQRDNPRPISENLPVPRFQASTKLLK